MSACPEKTKRLPNLSQALETGSWSGKPAFVIGGGPSLKGFDFSQLDDERFHVIAANAAIVHVPFADAVCFMDARVPQLLRRQPAWQTTKALKIAHKSCEGEMIKWPEEELENVHVIPNDREWQDKWGGTIEDGIPHTTNTGGFALLLADILGADPIFLLGFDMYGEGKKTANYHDVYPSAWHGNACVYDRYDDSFLQALRFSRRRIVNCNPKSNLYYFAKCEPHHALQLARGECTFDQLFPDRRDIGTNSGVFKIPAMSGEDPIRGIVKSTPPDVRLGELAEEKTNMGTLLMELRELGKQVDSVVEFGTGKFCRSLIAWIAARVPKIDSYDIKPVPEPMRLEIEDMARQAHVEVRLHHEDSREVQLDRDVDLLFIDSLHTGKQLRIELVNNHKRVGRYLVFHDVVTHGWNGEKPGIPIPAKFLHSNIADVVGDGLLPVIFQFLASNPEWQVKRFFTQNHGMLVLERRAK